MLKQRNWANWDELGVFSVPREASGERARSGEVVAGFTKASNRTGIVCLEVSCPLAGYPQSGTVVPPTAHPTLSFVMWEMNAISQLDMNSKVSGGGRRQSEDSQKLSVFRERWEIHSRFQLRKSRVWITTTG